MRRADEHTKSRHTKSCQKLTISRRLLQLSFTRSNPSIAQLKLSKSSAAVTKANGLGVPEEQSGLVGRPDQAIPQLSVGIIDVEYPTSMILGDWIICVVAATGFAIMMTAVQSI